MSYSIAAIVGLDFFLERKLFCVKSDPSAESQYISVECFVPLGLCGKIKNAGLKPERLDLK